MSSFRVPFDPGGRTLWQAGWAGSWVGNVHAGIRDLGLREPEGQGQGCFLCPLLAGGLCPGLEVLSWAPQGTVGLRGLGDGLQP